MACVSLSFAQSPSTSSRQFLPKPFNFMKAKGVVFHKAATVVLKIDPSLYHVFIITQRVSDKTDFDDLMTINILVFQSKDWENLERIPTAIF